MTRIRRVTAAVAVVLLLAPAAAWAHAEISPAVSLSGKLQLYSLAVPTEKSGAVTTQVELSLPSGFSIDSFVPAPGWHRVLQQTGSGDNAVIQKVTWTGGRVPTGEDSLFQFLATPASSQTYTFTVRQTYSDGGVVNWSGPGVLGRAGTVDRGEEHPRRGGGGTSALTIVALIVAVLGLLAAALALLSGGRASGGRPLA